MLDKCIPLCCGMILGLHWRSHTTHNHSLDLWLVVCCIASWAPLYYGLNNYFQHIIRYFIRSSLEFQSFLGCRLQSSEELCTSALALIAIAFGLCPPMFRSSKRQLLFILHRTISQVSCYSCQMDFYSSYKSDIYFWQNKFNFNINSFINVTIKHIVVAYCLL